MEVLKQVDLVHIGLVADRDELGKSEPSVRAKSRTAVQSAPLWEMKEMFPGWASGRKKLAFMLTLGRGLMTPRQFGPTTRTPASRQIETILFSASNPFFPTSRNPATR